MNNNVMNTSGQSNIESKSQKYLSPSIPNFEKLVEPQLSASKESNKKSAESQKSGMFKPEETLANHQFENTSDIPASQQTEIASGISATSGSSPVIEVRSFISQSENTDITQNDSKHQNDSEKTSTSNIFNAEAQKSSQLSEVSQVDSTMQQQHVSSQSASTDLNNLLKIAQQQSGPSAQQNVTQRASQPSSAQGIQQLNEQQHHQPQVQRFQQDPQQMLAREQNFQQMLLQKQRLQQQQQENRSADVGISARPDIHPSAVLAGSQSEMKRRVMQEGGIDDITDDEDDDQEEVYDEPAGALYCVCRKPYEETDFMIECDRCHEWYHGRCVDIDEAFSKRIDKYFCFRCRKNSKPIEGYCVLKTLKRRQTTQRAAGKSRSYDSYRNDPNIRTGQQSRHRDNLRPSENGIKRLTNSTDRSFNGGPPADKRRKPSFPSGDAINSSNIGDPSKNGPNREKCRLITCNELLTSTSSAFCSDTCENYYGQTRRERQASQQQNGDDVPNTPETDSAEELAARQQQAEKLQTFQSQLQQIRTQHQQYTVAVQQLQSEFQTRSQQRQVLIQRHTQLQQSLQKPGQSQNPAELQEFQQIQLQVGQLEQSIQQCQGRYSQYIQAMQRLQQQNHQILDQVQRIQNSSDSGTTQSSDATQSTNDIILNIRRKAIGAFMQILSGAVSLSQKIELNLFNRFGQDSQSWKRDIDFEKIEPLPNNEISQEKAYDNDKPLTVTESDEKDGQTAYSLNVARAILRLAKFSVVRTEVVQENISPADFVTLDGKKINAIQEIGSQRRQFNKAFSEILGPELAKQIEEFPYFRIDFNNSDLSLKRCSAIYQRLTRDHSLVEKVRLGEIKFDMLAQFADQVILGSTPKSEIPDIVDDPKLQQTIEAGMSSTSKAMQDSVKTSSDLTAATSTNSTDIHTSTNSIKSRSAVNMNESTVSRESHQSQSSVSDTLAVDVPSVGKNVSTIADSTETEKTSVAMEIDTDKILKYNIIENQQTTSSEISSTTNSSSVTGISTSNTSINKSDVSKFASNDGQSQNNDATDQNKIYDSEIKNSNGNLSDEKLKNTEISQKIQSSILPEDPASSFLS